MELHCTKDERGYKPGYRTVYVYDEPNIHGEQLIVEMGRGYINREWIKRGYFPKGAELWVHCTVEYRDADGIAWAGQKKGYNPTIRKATPDEIAARVTGCGYVTEFDWVLEFNDENWERVLQEVERRFYGAAKTERHERAAA